jgi:hypothetical protein
MLLFEWAYERQDITVYEELFSDDYRFAFAAADSAGNPPLTRDDELQVARNLFIAGSATEPPANKITLDYATDIVARNDRRPGKTAPWHKEISVRVVLRVETDEITHQVDGKALFFVVRGDSAQIPDDLLLRLQKLSPTLVFAQEQSGWSREWLANPAYKTGKDRSNNRDALNREIEAKIVARGSAEWVERLNAAGVPTGPIYAIDQVFADPQVKHLGIAQTVQSPVKGRMELVGQPIHLNRTPSRMERPPPEQGQHTDEVLREFGYSDGEIADFRRRHIV